jgi:hypothetical protein
VRILLVAAVALLSGWPAGAQSRISPRVPVSGGSGYLVQFHEGADMDRARRWMENNGFDVIEHPDLRRNHLLATGPRWRLDAVAEDENVDSIVPASLELLRRERVIACAGGIAPNGGVADYTAVGRGWPKDAGGRVALHYFVQSLSPKIEENAARGEIERALREWQKYGSVTLTPVNAADLPRTVTIRFAAREHGDGLAFDGPRGVLAHTFYPAPLNPEPIAGDTHLDAEEDWHIGTSIDLYSVVLHEAGHALGLGHSDQPGAVMYPYYRFAHGLTSDDIAAIQDLYGAPAGTPPVTPAPPAPTPPPAPPPAPPAQPPAGTPSADRTAPALRITSPGTTVISTSAASLPVSGTASDDVGVVAVKWTTSSGDSGTAAGTTSWSASIPLYVGNTVVTVRAYDAAGNSGWRAITVTRR